MPKRTKLWSNSRLVIKFRTGKLMKRTGKKVESGVRKYVDKQGKTRVAASKQLKLSQNLLCKMWPCIYAMCELHMYTYTQYISAIITNYCTYILCGDLRKYPVRFAREIVDTIPLFRCGPANCLPPEASLLALQLRLGLGLAVYWFGRLVYGRPAVDTTVKHFINQCESSCC